MAIARPLILLMLIEGATVLLVRLAPGYFSSQDALDPRLSAIAAQHSAQERAAAASPVVESLTEDVNLLRGKLGTSRYYQVPVSELLEPRWPVTLRLLAGGIGSAWFAACILLIPSIVLRRKKRAAAERTLHVPAVLLIAIPAGAMAAVSVASDYGTPALVLALFLAPRVYRFLTVLLQSHLDAEHILFARAGGLTLRRILLGHVMPAALPELLALLGTSLVFALGALVPIEVLFDIPGLAQLAFTSALNRDLPLIAATTLVAAAAVVVAAVLADCFPDRRQRARAAIPEQAIMELS